MRVRGAWPLTSSAASTRLTAEPWPSAGLAVKPMIKSGRESSRSSTCWATSSGISRLSRTSAMFCLREADVGFDAEAAEQDGQEDQGQRGRGEQAADHDDGQRALHFRTGAAGEEHRNPAEGGDAGGHQHRPQAAFGTLDYRFA